MEVKPGPQVLAALRVVMDEEGRAVVAALLAAFRDQMSPGAAEHLEGGRFMQRLDIDHDDAWRVVFEPSSDVIHVVELLRGRDVVEALAAPGPW